MDKTYKELCDEYYTSPNGIAFAYEQRNVIAALKSENNAIQGRERLQIVREINGTYAPSLPQRGMARLIIVVSVSARQDAFLRPRLFKRNQNKQDMATIGYLRYSTDKQDEQSQLNIIKPYLAAKGMALDKVYKDEGVSGGVSYKSRNLFHLCEDAQKGDIVVISEVSRLTRAGFGEIYEIINTYFKPNNMRLIVCNVGLDIDCTSLEGNPMMELQLSMLATFAKIERQLIKERTRAGLAAKREQRVSAGLPASWTSEYGKNTGATHAQTLTKAREARARNQRLKANENPNNEKFWSQVQIFERAHSMCVLDDIEAFTQDLITAKVKTATGLDMTPARARSMYHNMKLRYS